MVKTNEQIIKGANLRLKIKVEFYLNLGTIGVDAPIDITSYVLNLPRLDERLSLSTQSTGGVILPNINISLDNTRGHFFPEGKFFKNGFVNNSKIKITTSYLDGDDIVADGFIFSGLIKSAFVNWEMVSRRFIVTLISADNILKNNEVNLSAISNGISFANCVYNLLNQPETTKYINVSLSNINPAVDASDMVSAISVLSGKNIKDVLDAIAYLSGSIYYVDSSDNFIMEPIATNPVSAEYTFTKNDIFAIGEFGYDYRGQTNAFIWGSASLAMSGQIRLQKQYDFRPEELGDDFNFVTAANNKNIILQNLLSLYQDLKRRIVFDVKFNPEIKVNTFIKISLEEEIIIDDNSFIWNLSNWNAGKIYGIKTSAIVISENVFWRVTEIERSLEGENMIITAQEV